LSSSISEGKGGVFHRKMWRSLVVALFLLASISYAQEQQAADATLSEDLQGPMAMIASLQTARPSEGWKQFDGIRSKLARATKGVSIYSRIIRRALRGIKTASQNVLKINTATATNLTITTVLHGSVRTLNRAIGRITRRTTRLALALKDVTLRPR